MHIGAAHAFVGSEHQTSFVIFRLFLHLTAITKFSKTTSSENYSDRKMMNTKQCLKTWAQSEGKNHLCNWEH